MWEHDAERVASLAGFDWIGRIPLKVTCHSYSFDRNSVPAGADDRATRHVPGAGRRFQQTRILCRDSYG
jgi:hypothetical protein